MQTSHALYSKISIKQLILSITFFSLLLGWRLIYIEHGWVNDDFVLYHEVARLFSIGEFKEGFKLYNWPLYSGLISAVHLWTGLSLLVAAQCLNVLFFGLTTFSFLHLISLAGGEKLTIAAGAMLLFSAHYVTGDVIAMLVRDPAFWAFFLTSLIFFIQFCQEPSTKNALLWQLFAIIATLFRIEGLMFLILLPFILLTTDFANAPKTTPFIKRFYLLLKVNSLNIAILLGFTALFIVSPNITIKDLGRLQEVTALFDNKVGYIFSTLESRSNLLATEVLKGHFDDYAFQGLFLALFGITLLKIIGALGWFNLGLSSYFFFKKSHTVNLNVQRILVYVAIIAFINIIVILLSVMLLATRYTAPLVIVLLIFAAFSLGNLLNSLANIQWQHKPKLNVFRSLKLENWLTICILLGILVSFIGMTLPKKAGNNFEQEAVAYLVEKKIPNKAVFFVSPRARFYAGANYAGRGYEYWDFTQEAILNQSIYQYEYLLINIYIDDTYAKRKAFLDANLKDYVLEKEFYGFKNKKKVMFYHRKH